jgi:hypothetical protein
MPYEHIPIVVGMRIWHRNHNIHGTIVALNPNSDISPFDIVLDGETEVFGSNLGYCQIVSGLTALGNKID